MANYDPDEEKDERTPYGYGPNFNKDTDSENDDTAREEAYQSPSSYYNTSSYRKPPASYYSNGDGTKALVFGLIAMTCCSPLGIAAIIFGRRGMENPYANPSYAKVGYILGWVSLAVLVFNILFTIATGSTPWQSI